MSKRVMWEYKQYNSFLQTSEMNDLGLLCWELVTVIWHPDVAPTFIFKRPR